MSSVAFFLNIIIIFLQRLGMCYFRR
uniref:Uncharacterized protein n=1 Tax=Anguilla anguilla TaxID=7936 RepID=A0A0E9TWB6_ANGAN